MKRGFTTLITIVCVMLFASSWSEAVTFTVVDATNQQPYLLGDEFTKEIHIDASDLSPDQRIGTFSIHLDYEEAYLEVVLQPGDKPFIPGDFLPIVGLVLELENGPKPPEGQPIYFAVGDLNNIGTDADTGVLASVTFRVIATTSLVTEEFLDVGDPGTAHPTAYTLTTGAFQEPVPDDSVEQALPVELSFLTASSVSNGVVVKWQTESEINNLGFDIYRSESPDGKFIKVNPAYIKGAGTDATPHNYKFVDESAVIGKTYYYYLETINFSGERERSHIIKVIVDVSGKVKVTGLMQPTTFALLQNFPNPFNPETWIPFHLAKDADVTIRIFDIRGQEIRTIHLGQKPAGYYDTKGKAVLWDGRDSYGQEISSGIYFYNLTAGKFHATRKLTIIK